MSTQTKNTSSERKRQKKLLDKVEQDSQLEALLEEFKTFSDNKLPPSKQQKRIKERNIKFVLETLALWRYLTNGTHEITDESGIS